MRITRVGKVSAEAGIKKYSQLKGKLDEIKKAPETVIQRTVSDVKKRGPGWIATGVIEEYNIKKKEIVPAKSDSKAAGVIGVKGKTIAALQITYKGRNLTPIHFGMSPTIPKPNRGSYTLKAEIKKGKRTVLGKYKKLTKKQAINLSKNFRREGTQSSPFSPIMLLRTGNTYVPFQRKSQVRNDLKVIRTVSVPQMVTQGKNGPLHHAPAKHFSEGLEKRFAHHSKLLNK